MPGLLLIRPLLNTAGITALTGGWLLTLEDLDQPQGCLQERHSLSADPPRRVIRGE